MTQFEDLSEGNISQRAGKERIMEILVFLLSEIRSNKKLLDIDLKPLSQRGFSQTEISTAFSWLFDRIASDGSPIVLPEISKSARSGSERATSSFRVYHEAERSVLTVSAQGYLLQLQELGLITAGDMEAIIDRVMAAGVPTVSLSEIKELVGIMVFDFDDSNRMGSRLMLGMSDRIQ
jgi:Smg protein